MNRVSLCAFAAALWLACSANILAQSLPADDRAWSHAVNLIPLIDLEKDTINGTWRITEGALVSGSEAYARIQIPYEPPDEYDFRIVFVRTSGNGDVKQIVSRLGRAMAWSMGVGNNKLFGFGVVHGKNLGQNATTVESEACLTNGRVTASTVQVRRRCVKAYVDGKLISQLETDFSDLTLSSRWEMPNRRLLGVGCFGSITEFQKIELLEITGKGKRVPDTERVVTKREPEKPKPHVASRTENEPRPPRVAEMADLSLQKDAKKFGRNQSSIHGLYVLKLDNGQRVGSAQDIIATAERAASDRETVCDFTTEVANDTRISMEEAERLLKVRYPVWQAGYKIRFSYGNKYAKQSGGSAGGAFAVLLQSLLDGFQIDPAYAMTGDVTVDGKIREIGAAAEKIRGAVLEKCRVIAIPEANKENLSDMVLLYSPAMLWSAQLFSIATLDDAAAVARKDRSENLTKALALFAEVQARLSPNAGAAALRASWVYQSLREVQRLAPNHLSAEFMLRAANNQLPSTLSLGESLEQVWAAAGPLLGFLFADYKEPEKSKRYYMSRVPKETTKMALDRLEWLQMRLHPKARDLKVAMVDYMVSLDQLHRMSTFASGTLRQHLEKRDKVLGEAGKLGVDRKVLEEMMH